MSHTNIVRIEIQNTDVLFEGLKKGGLRPCSNNKFLLCLTKRHSCVYVYIDNIYVIYFTWDGLGKVNVMKIILNENLYSKYLVFKCNASLYMPHIIGVLNCS